MVKKKKTAESKFSFETILSKYAKDADALSVLLDKKELYCLSDVSAKLEAFYKREVR